MAMAGGPLMGQMRLHLDRESLTRQQIKPGTARRILPYALHYRWSMGFMLLTTATSAVITAANPLILKTIIDQGILGRRLPVVVGLCLLLAGLALVDALAMYLQVLFSGRIGQGLIYDLRTKVFRHVQQQPIALST